MSDAIPYALAEARLPLHSTTNVTEATSADEFASVEGLEVACTCSGCATVSAAEFAKIMKEAVEHVATLVGVDPLAKLKGAIVGPMSHENLAQHLMITSKELHDWLQSTEFQPFFKELYENYIMPNQTKTPGEERPAEPTLLEVEYAIEREERRALLKYTDDYGDTSSFKAIDWLAKFIVKCRERNVRYRDGMFFRKGMDEASMNSRLWMAYRLCSDEHGARQVLQPANSHDQAEQENVLPNASDL